MGDDGLEVPNPIVYPRTPRSVACLAASNGSGPALLAPSVKSTMICGTYWPLGVGVAAPVDVPPVLSLDLIWLSISAIASKERRIALPIAVRRAVVKLFMAFSNNV